MTLLLVKFALYLGVSLFFVTFVSMSFVDLIMQKVFKKGDLNTYFSILKWIEWFKKHQIYNRVQVYLKEFDNRIAKENNLV